MRVTIFFLFAIILSPAYFSAQPSFVDSLKRCIYTGLDPAHRSEQIYRLGVYYSGKFLSDSVKLYVDLLQEEATRSGKCSDKANVADLWGRYYYVRGSYREAIARLEEARGLYSTCEDPEKRARTCRVMASCYFEIQMFGEALRLTLEALPYYEGKKDSLILGRLYCNIGKYMTDIGQYAEAREYLFQGLAITRDISASEFLILGEIGDYYAATNRTDSSLLFYEMALSDGEKTQEPYTLNGGKTGFCNACIDAGRLDKARPSCYSAYQYYQSVGNTPEWVQINAVVSRLETRSGNPAKGLQYAQVAIAAARTPNDDKWLEMAYKAASDASAALGNYKAAWHYALEWKNTSEKLTTSSQQEKTVELEARYRTREQQAMIAEQQLGLERTKHRSLTIQWVAGIILLLAMAGFALWRFKTLNQQQKVTHTLEIERTKAGQLAENERLRSNFLANISHEFRTPLMLILSPLQVLRQGNMPAVELMRHYDRMERNARRLLELVNQLLDLSKLESKESVLCPTAGNLSQALRFIAGNFESLAVQQHIQYQVSIPEADILAHFDRDKLEKIITNLLSNAFKFTPAGGNINLALEVELTNSEDFGAKIRVSDNGIGLDAIQQANIFRRFYFVEQMNNTEQAGTGIGLALVKELVELHKGSIKLESESGKGSIFTVWLPLKKANTPAPVSSGVTPEDDLPPRQTASYDQAAGENAMASGLYRATILIVDDNSEIRAFLREELSKQFEILEAADGRTGIETAIENLPDIVLCDVMMPVMDGMAFSASLRANRQSSHIPIIMLTASTRREDRFEGLRRGVDAYLVKPFDPEELALIIGNTLNRQQTMREKYSRLFRILPTDEQVSSVEERFLADVRAAIEKNIGNEFFGVESLADEISMSRVHLYRKLQVLTGQSPTALIREMRMTRARHLLESGAGNASEVAYSVGFGSPAYFSTVFTSHFGINPSEVKKIK